MKIWRKFWARKFRRQWFLALIAVGLSVVVFGNYAPPIGARTGFGSRTVTVKEGTNIAATVSPDHSRIIMDLQGVLWGLPLGGGNATRLTDDFLEPARPHWSPQEDAIAFQAYADGAFHIWIMKPDGSQVRQLTFGHGDDREPRFSPDGTKIAFASDRAFAGSYDIWVVDVASGNLTQWTRGPADEFEPTWSPDATEIAFVSGNGATGTTIQAVDASGTSRIVVTAPTGSRLNSPSWSPDGTEIAYEQFANNRSQLLVSGRQVGTSNDVFPFQANWLSDNELLYTADGKIQIASLDTGATRDIPFEAQFRLNRPPYDLKRFDFDSKQQVKGIVSPALSPDGKHVVFEALNQLWVMEIGKKPYKITDDSYYKTDPAWSPDGTRIAYSSDKAGTEDIYVIDVATKAEQQVTSLPGAEVSSAWSPDGTAIAFQDQNGATYTIELGTGDVRQVVGPLFAPSKPTWYTNGNTLALGALKPYTRRFREGTSQILTVDLATNAQTYTEPAPFKSISTRGDEGPVYSPDGSAVAFVMESVLWVQSVDANGVPNGEARQITQEATDAPTWSGDSRELLYLSNGKLCLVSRDGGNPREVPLDLAWKPESPRGRTIIHAGHLWDGRGSKVLTNVDIVVAGNRIARIRPHRRARDGDRNTRYIDASNLTVLPGLWETHTHQYISGKFYGDRLGRLWMAYGVTALNSVGDPVYRAVETRESYASGDRVGPRFFATGEAVDGERVYYNFMRPVTNGDAQLDLELSRAQALDYDNIKTYVRLTHADQAKVIQFAHDVMGVPVTSHYMLPSMAYGQDGQTHLSATTRTGFAYTRSSAGISYQDVRDLFSLSGMFVISTTFNSSLYAEDPAMVDDLRLVTLNTPWDQAGLRTKRDSAVNTDQTISLERLEQEEATIKSIIQGGGTVLAGTDSPIDNVATALHLNLRAQVKYGRTPWQALQTATLLSAQEVGVDNDLGTVEPGKIADLTFVLGNPLDDIKDAANVQSVMKNGKYYSVAELIEPFSLAATARSIITQAPPRHRVLPPANYSASIKKYWWHDPEQIKDDHH